MLTNTHKTIGEIVAEDFRAASIFAKYKIDFCCKGDRTVNDVCEKKSISPQELIEQLTQVTSKKEENIDFNSWPLDLLIDYIVKMHHGYIREKSPSLLQFLDKVEKVHGERHPELYQIYNLFSESAEDLGVHIVKEENILFPYIKKISETQSLSEPLERPHFGSVENPINMMKDDHAEEGERFRKIAELTNNYTPPAEACNTYKVAFAMLEEFEQNLHKHIHLENNILFIKAIKIEEKTLSN